MALINSSDFLLYAGETPMGHSKETTFSLSADMVDMTSKSSEGWQEFLQGVRSGRLTTSGLTDYNDTLNFEQLVSYVITRQTVNFFFKDFAGGDFVINGTGYIENVTENADAEGLVNFDVDIVLYGLVSAGDQRVWNTIFEAWNSIAIQWQNL